jgi:hypothetical protein
MSTDISYEYFASIHVAEEQAKKETSMNKDVTGSSETSVYFYRTTWHCVPDDRIFLNNKPSTEFVPLLFSVNLYKNPRSLQEENASIKIYIKVRNGW